MWNSQKRTSQSADWKISEDSQQILYIYCNLWYNNPMKYTEMNETSNREMITISRAEYEAMQVRLAEQNQLLNAKSAELAQALLQNRWLMEQLKLNKL